MAKKHQSSTPNPNETSTQFQNQESQTMNAPTEATKKPATEYTVVEMSDGTSVRFPGKTRMLKSYLIDEDSQTISFRIDFRNGRVVTLSTEKFSIGLLLRAAAHGLSQKIGDAAASVKDLDDAVLACEDVAKRLSGGTTESWGAERESGDSFAGASIVVKAICEVTGKTPEEVKAFLQSKLDAAKAKDEKLSRADLYKSFRNPNGSVGKVIARLEAEKAAESPVKAEDLLAELGTAE